jgi:hypothetical protein
MSGVPASVTKQLLEIPCHQIVTAKAGRRNLQSKDFEHKGKNLQGGDEA